MEKSEEDSCSSCLCPYDYERHGKCDECQDYHHKINEKTHCGK